MAKQTKRNAESHGSFIVPIAITPMLFEYIQGEKLYAKIIGHTSVDKFEADKEPLKLFSLELSFESNQLENLLLEDNVAPNGLTVGQMVGALKSKALEAGDFKPGDEIKRIFINGYDYYAEINAQRSGSGNDPSAYFGSFEDKFTKLREDNPELMQLLFFLLIYLAAEKTTAENQPIFQQVLENILNK